MIPAERIHELIGENYKVTVIPPKFTGFRPSEIILNKHQFERYIEWLHGKSLIQDVLPELSSSDREILISGISPEDWDLMKGIS